MKLAESGIEIEFLWTMDGLGGILRSLGAALVTVIVKF
jgi:hypothetical protein